MGGEATAVDADTTSVYVEAAFWWPQALQGARGAMDSPARQGHRFERGVDFADTVAGVERVTQLILEICGGAAGPHRRSCRSICRNETRFACAPARADKVLGIELQCEQIARLLSGLRSRIREGRATRSDVTPPSHRFDLTIEEDLIEELARVHGFDNIPALVPKAPLGDVGRGRRRCARRWR